MVYVLPARLRCVQSVMLVAMLVLVRLLLVVMMTEKQPVVMLFARNV